jgi:hypothetical protein
MEIKGSRVEYVCALKKATATSGIMLPGAQAAAAPNQTREGQSRGLPKKVSRAKQAKR